VLGIVFLAGCVALVLAPELSPLRALRLMAFDTLQRAAPRRPASAPAVIVAIDDRSLAAHGQWPWPRTTLARLLRRIGDGGPAAVGVDIVMPEPDRLSPDRLPKLVSGIEPDLAARLARLPSNDARLGGVLRTLPSVVAIVGLEVPQTTLAPLIGRTPILIRGGDPGPFVRHFAAALRSVEEIDGSAAGHALVNATRSGVVRRVPLVAMVGDTLLPTLAVEMLRVATGQPAVTVTVGTPGVESVAVGHVAISTQSDGSVWVRYGPPAPARFVSAADVLSGHANPAQFGRKLVLVGVTATGLGDYHATPVSPRMLGIEIHAQVLENIFDDDFLMRPRWAKGMEAAALAVGGLLLILAVPALPVRVAVPVAPAVLVAVVGLSFVLFWRFHLLVDIVGPSLGLVLTSGVLLGTMLVEAQGQRRALRRQLEAEREDAARLAGELAAARRIQLGNLPSPAAVLAGEDRVGLYAFMEPARGVGGDLYDFFMLDGDRLLVLIGDVTGKGIASGVFMAVSKALCKSAALRHRGDLAAMLRDANAEISRDNAGALFVTVWVGVLDLTTGNLDYCNAGHEPARAVGREASIPSRLADGGPPFCVIEDFPFVPVSHRLRPGETVCLVTDGVTEAANAAGELYGRARLDALLARVGADASPDEVGATIREDVARFTAGAEASDDLAIVVVTWRGGAPPISGR
jgi:CHASE2 domain-containing sensor protein/serine phosphatase RsbU (regulator of sigma subunit)